MSSGTLFSSRYKYCHSLFTMSLHGTVQIKQKNTPASAKIRSSKQYHLSPRHHQSHSPPRILACLVAVAVSEVYFHPLPSSPALSSLNILASPLSTFFPLPLMNHTFHLTGRRSTWTLALHDVRALLQSPSTLRLSTQTNPVILQCDDFLTSYDQVKLTW